jgi:hypothetical protein
MCCIRESQLKLVVVCVYIYIYIHVHMYKVIIWKKIQDNSYQIIAQQFLPSLSLKLTFPFSQANSLHCTIT